MARTAIPVTVINRDPGVAPATLTATDPTNGNEVTNNGHVWLEASNTDAATQTLTIRPVGTVDGYAVAGVTHDIAAGDDLRIGPFPLDSYGGQIEIDSTAATLKLAAYRLEH